MGGRRREREGKTGSSTPLIRTDGEWICHFFFVSCGSSCVFYSTPPLVREDGRVRYTKILCSIRHLQKRHKKRHPLEEKGLSTKFFAYSYVKMAQQFPKRDICEKYDKDGRRSLLSMLLSN